jgi:ABC-type branched-subunit amino acid transport system ATPase component
MYASPSRTSERGDASTTALQIEGLRRRLGGVEAVAGVSFAVPSGVTVGLIGPNGAGKSTLVSLIAGTRRPDAGSVTVFGNEVSQLPAWSRARLGLARTFQLSAEFARLTVLENLLVATRNPAGETVWGALFRRRHWMTLERAHAERAWELLRRFRLEHKANAYAGLLSGGEKRLVEIMRGLMSQPRVLLLDEPMAGINPTLREEISEYLWSLRHDGLTMILVEHELEAVERLCDRVLVMANGRIVGEGEYRDVIQMGEVVDAYIKG